VAVEEVAAAVGALAPLREIQEVGG
jgi:hypothetical protein